MTSTVSNDENKLINAIIMGRCTADTLKTPLLNRLNIFYKI